MFFNKILSKLLIAFISFLSMLPNMLLNQLVYVIYFIVYKIISYRLDVIRLNLMTVFPHKSSLELSIIEKRFYKHLAYLIIQHIQSISFSTNDLKSRIWLHHQAKQDLMLAEKSGKNIFVVTAHYGNWEYAVLLTSLESKLKTFGIYKELNNKIFNSFFVKNRSRFGLQLINTNDIKIDINKVNLIKSIYCFISDQTPVNIDKAYNTSFMGIKNTPFYKGFMQMAQQSSAIVFYASIHNIDEEHYEIKFKKISDDAALDDVDFLMQQYVQLLEADINLNPQYWLWTHKRWKRAGINY